MRGKDIVWILILISAAFFAGKYLFPRIEEREITIPVIKTQFDTVSVVPSWVADSIKKLLRRPATRDTHEIIITNTIVDTEFVSIPCDTAQRPRLWPVQAYIGGATFGDTGIVTTFSLRSGQGSVSKVFIPGILTELIADSTPIPHIVFQPFPKPKGPALFYRAKLLGTGVLGGFSACALLK